MTPTDVYGNIHVMSTTRLTFTADPDTGLPVAIVNGKRLDLDHLEVAAAWAAHIKAARMGAAQDPKHERTNALLTEVTHFDLLVAARKLAGPQFAPTTPEREAVMLTAFFEDAYGENTSVLLHNGLCRVYALHPEAHQIERAAA